jgi:hypothetical protein
MPHAPYDLPRTGLLHEAMHAAHDVNGPTFAHAILTTGELTAALGAA